MGDLSVDPDRLDESGRALEQVAARLGDALQAFQAELQGFGRPWGSDDIGSLIGVAHDEVSSYAFECYQSVLDEIASAGEDVSGMATLHRVNEAEIHRRFTSMHDSLGRG
ncbi:hypothetical protein AB0J86_01590 [Micromonospora sp. NPDC049559]|uniref:hypothetical protein n=1 Tax=Micromonospora sp. NPDC049559 TaxID=3155923 RepID=UPI00343B2162